MGSYPFASWLRWEHNDARMPLVVGIWTTVILNRRFFLYTAPPWIIAALVSQMKGADLKRYMDRSLSTLLVGWLVWVVALSTLGTTVTIWLFGCGLLTWNSPWANLARTYFRAANHAEHSPVKRNAAVEEHLYQFVAIEHQRWLGGWTDRMLPRERPAWSDEYLQAVPPTDEFTLPPPSKNGYWGWADSCWRIYDHEVATDKDGWEYTTWDWSPQLATWAPFRSTRRRRWVRCARWEDTSRDMRPGTPSIRRKSSCNSSRTASTANSANSHFSHTSNNSSTNSLLSAITSFSNSSTCASVKTEPTTALSTGSIEMTRILSELPCVANG